MRGNDRAVFDKAIGHFNGLGQQPAGISADVDDQATHPVAMQPPQSRVDVVTGCLLETADAEVSDTALCRRPSSRLRRSAPQLARVALPRLDWKCIRSHQGDLNERALLAFEHVSSAIGGDVASRLTVDGNDAITRLDAGSFGRPLGNHIRDQTANRHPPSARYQDQQSYLRSVNRHRPTDRRSGMSNRRPGSWRNHTCTPE